MAARSNDQDIALFEGAVWELRADGVLAGYVSAEVGRLWFPPSGEPWVWLVAFWIDGTKERAVEDYAPWTYVNELRAGQFDWMDGRDPSKHRLYEAHLLDPEQGHLIRDRFGVTTDDF